MNSSVTWCRYATVALETVKVTKHDTRVPFLRHSVEKYSRVFLATDSYTFIFQVS